MIGNDVMKAHWNIGIISLLVFLIPIQAMGTTVSDIASMLANVEATVPQITKLVVALCYTMGVGMILKSVYMLKMYGQGQTMMSQHHSISKPFIVLFCGIGCLYIPTIISISVDSLWAYGSGSVLQYPTDTTNWDAVVNPLLSIVRLFGLIAFVRGWTLLVKLGAEQAQPGTLGKGIMHMLGGVLAMNIVGTINVVKATLGM